MDSLYIIKYETSHKCECNYKYSCYDKNLLNCINKYKIYKYCPFMKLINEDIKISIHDNCQISDIKDFFNILEYLLLWAHKSENYNFNIKLRVIIMLSVCHFIITNQDYLEDVIIFYNRFIDQVILLLNTNFIPKKNRIHFLKLFEECFIEESDICVNMVFNWLHYFEYINITNKP